MLVGYARVSKSDGSQSLVLQRDALQMADVLDDHVYTAHKAHACKPGFLTPSNQALVRSSIQAS